MYVLVISIDIGSYGLSSNINWLNLFFTLVKEILQAVEFGLGPHTQHSTPYQHGEEASSYHLYKSERSSASLLSALSGKENTL
jgi:hypothetical protein